MMVVRGRDKMCSTGGSERADGEERNLRFNSQGDKCDETSNGRQMYKEGQAGVWAHLHVLFRVKDQGVEGTAKQSIARTTYRNDLLLLKIKRKT